MALTTKVFGKHKTFMLERGNLTHAQAKKRAKELRKKGVEARIAMFEGSWATWIKKVR